MQIASRNAVVDQRGLYMTTISNKYVVSRGSINTAEKYVIETEFGKTIENQAKKKYWWTVSVKTSLLILFGKIKIGLKGN